MRKKVIIALLIVVASMGAKAQNNGQVLFSGDFYEKYYYLGNFIVDRNVKITCYENVAIKEAYKRGTRELSGSVWKYYYDHTDANGNRIYDARDGSMFFASSKFILYSNNTFEIKTSTGSFVITNGFKDLQPANQYAQPATNGSYNNTYNSGSNNSSNSGKTYCGVCNGSGKCIGCHGSGFTKDPYGRDCPCGACTKSGNVPGNCNVCHGTGARTY